MQVASIARASKFADDCADDAQCYFCHKQSFQLRSIEMLLLVARERTDNKEFVIAQNIATIEKAIRIA